MLKKAMEKGKKSLQTPVTQKTPMYREKEIPAEILEACKNEAAMHKKDNSVQKFKRNSPQSFSSFQSNCEIIFKWKMSNFSLQLIH